jgi:DNA-binding MarR family transcriptional regulator
MSLEGSPNWPDSNFSEGDLDRAFSLLKIIRDYNRSRFPFLRTRLDFDLLLFIGHCQVLGKPMNLTDILTSNLGSVSTVVRHLGRLEKLNVVIKRKAAADKRNVHYFLADAHLEAMRELIEHLQRNGAAGMLSLPDGEQVLRRHH